MWGWADFPHEVRYDQFGIAVAEAVYGRAKVESEFTSIIEKGFSKDVTRLEKALSQPRYDLDGLREDMACVCQPYREALLRLWRAHKASKTPGVTQFISRLESLWEARTV